MASRSGGRKRATEFHQAGGGLRGVRIDLQELGEGGAFARFVAKSAADEGERLIGIELLAIVRLGGDDFFQLRLRLFPVLVLRQLGNPHHRGGVALGMGGDPCRRILAVGDVFVVGQWVTSRDRGRRRRRFFWRNPGRRIRVRRCGSVRFARACSSGLPADRSARIECMASIPKRPTMNSDHQRGVIVAEHDVRPGEGLVEFHDVRHFS